MTPCADKEIIFELRCSTPEGVQHQPGNEKDNDTDCSQQKTQDATWYLTKAKQGEKR